ncbi:hypothetical protein [Nocardia sp. NPDC052112]|uniref:hypothetical protein n=1 Tax=Nocardia sp. NPDC052112 TaxID=3155646 RepID=UPI00342ECB21
MSDKRRLRPVPTESAVVSPAPAVVCPEPTAVLPELTAVPTEPTAIRIRQLTARAGRAGYRLERATRVPFDWMLLDAEDGTNIYSSTDLEQIERWLDE